MIAENPLSTAEIISRLGLKERPGPDTELDSTLTPAPDRYSEKILEKLEEIACCLRSSTASASHLRPRSSDSIVDVIAFDSLGEPGWPIESLGGGVPGGLVIRPGYNWKVYGVMFKAIDRACADARIETVAMCGACVAGIELLRGKRLMSGMSQSRFLEVSWGSTGTIGPQCPLELTFRSFAHPCTQAHVMGALLVERHGRPHARPAAHRGDRRV